MTAPLALRAGHCPLGCACTAEGEGTCADMRAGPKPRLIVGIPGCTWACGRAYEAWVLAGRPALDMGPRPTFTVPLRPPPPAELPPVFRVDPAASEPLPDSLDGWQLYGDTEPVRPNELSEAEKQAAILERARGIAAHWDRLSRQPNLVLLGNEGTGKTLLLRILGRLALLEGVSVRFTQLDALVEDIKSTRSPLSGRTEEAVVESYVVPELLILDDVKPGPGDPAKNEEILHKVIKRRYGVDLGEPRRATWITSNLSVREVAEILGRPALDRLLDGGAEPLYFTWRSHRRVARTSP